MATTTDYDAAMSARYDDDFQAVFGGRDRGDLGFFQDLALASEGGGICEVGAGTGRVILAIAEVVEGRELYGVEPSAAMRAGFQDKLADPRYAAVRALAGGFGEIPLAAGSQALVFAAFRSFQHVLTVPEQLRALAEVRRVLRPGGTFALDLFDPAYRLLRRARPKLGVRYATGRGTTRERWESRAIDHLEQRVDVGFRWIERDAQRRIVSDEVASYSVRYTFPFELEHLLARAGFVEIAIRGGYDLAPRSAETHDLVAVCRAPSGASG
jgi:ubiquinone/menaquinone biosynthesis C-methylase UbiE